MESDLSQAERDRQYAAWSGARPVEPSPSNLERQRSREAYEILEEIRLFLRLHPELSFNLAMKDLEVWRLIEGQLTPEERLHVNLNVEA